ncbi:cytochrome P450 [Marasmius fiardii PR-910]|nr:cytochrome P450 [Marasmius fiardii PR-910]
MDSFSSTTVGFLIGSVFILFVLQKTVSLRRMLAGVGYHPGPRTLLSQRTIIANILPPMSGITSGKNHMFINKFRTFEHYGWDIIAPASAFPEEIDVTVASSAEITASRARFPKLVEDYEALLFFGSNIIASEGEIWKKYRKIASPAFNDRNNKLVWDETVKIMIGLFDSLWLNQEAATVDDCIELTLPIALFVIGVAGFGRSISWQDDVIIPAGHKLTFKEALSEVSEGVIAKMVLPRWLMGITEKTRKIKLAYEELDKYMLEMINARRTSEKKEERYDLFSSLLDANDSPDYGQDPLTERELIGNIFVFLLAGHETTAHTLAFTFGLLAFYQEEQEILYQHIKSIIPDGRIPTYEEMPLFTQSMAVFYETLRMFPPVNAIPKMSAEDTTLVAENAKGETKIVPIPRGTAVTINVVALHYNPRYWKDPYEFRPLRFRENWPRDAFLPFSGGARACIGRKFFETEGIAILTMLVSKYKITFKEEPKFAGETMEEKKERLFATKPGLTLS